jgi:hypothetical protein
MLLLFEGCDHSKDGTFQDWNAVAALQQFAGGVGPVRFIDLDLAAAAALVGAASF